jgi:polyvinyl alcohol dehydrogenase (cytochrome)
MHYSILLIALLLSACDQSSTQQESNSNVTTTAHAKTEGSQQYADIQAAKEALPGKAHYDRACIACHGGAVKRAPQREMIGLMTPESVLHTMTKGVMREEAQSLTDQEKREVAEYISGVKLGGELTPLPACDNKSATLASSSSINWGIQPENTRTIPTEVAGISSANITKLTTKWAIAFPDSSRVRSQPTFAGNQIFVGSHSGIVYSLDRDEGCATWAYIASAEVRTGITYSESGPNPMIFFGDVIGNVYGVNANTGEQMWRTRADDHPNATITGTPSLNNNMLYVPVSSLEVSLAINPNYECCTFRGSVAAIDATTGKIQWKSYTIKEEPAVTGQNSVGTNIMGPSGAVVWNSPSIDVINNQLYIGTGENMSSPASLTSDAMLAIDLDTGTLNWSFQATANDVWNTACDTTTPQNCPIENGPDFDFGGATIIVDTTKHGRLVIAGQKSGFVHALNPKDGSLIWQTRVGRGGIQGGIHFGIAASGETLLIPISDMADGRTYPTPDRPGMHALDANNGNFLWSTLLEDKCAGRAHCHPGISQVATVIGDLVIAGSMDGVARAYAIDTGKIVWELDTSQQEFTSTLGTLTKGGSMSGGAGPIADNGLLLLSSGYSLYNHMPGNLLLALEVEAQ